MGVSPLKGNAFVPSSYKGTIYVLQTKPVGAFPNEHLSQEDIEEAWIFDGCFPLSVPSDLLNSDLAGSDSIQYNVSFSYDGFPFRSSEGAIARCLEVYKTLGHSSYMDTQNKYEGAVQISGDASVGSE